MTFGLAFWILMAFWLFGGWWSDRWRGGWGVWGTDLLLFVLLGLLGWHSFGAPLHN